MRHTKLNLNRSIFEAEPDSIRFGKNGIMYPDHTNEKGFVKFGDKLPYPTYLGKIETNENVIVFSTDGINSAIGYLDYEKDEYVPILNDAELSYSLNFSEDSIIIGETRRNFRHDREFVWLELGSDNPPRFLNEENIPDSVEKLNLFHIENGPNLDVSIKDGGNLRQGTYYATVRYIDRSNSISNFYTPVGGVTATMNSIPTSADSVTNKAVSIDIEFPDDVRDEYQVAIIQIVGGVVTTRLMSKRQIPPNGRDTFEFTGGEEYTNISLEEILIPTAVYTKANTITQLNDSLFLGGVKEAPEENLQEEFNKCKILWKAKIIDHTDPRLKSGEMKTFKHGEVYAFFGRVIYKDSGIPSSLFHIPGGEHTVEGEEYTEDNISSVPTASVKESAVMTHRTVVAPFDFHLRGECGSYINKQERYPNEDEWGDLAGEKVRHHIFPRLDSVKDWYYKPNGDPADIDDSGFGVSEFSILGVSVDYDGFSTELKDRVERVELYYARRSYTNSMVPFQAIAQRYGVQQRDFNDNFDPETGKHKTYTNTGITISRIGDQNSYPANASYIFSSANNYNVVATEFNLMSPEILMDRPASTIVAVRPLYNIYGEYNEDEIWDEILYQKGASQPRISGVMVKGDMNFTAESPKARQGSLTGGRLSGVSESNYISVGQRTGRIDNFKGNKHLHISTGDQHNLLFRADYGFYNDETRFEEATIVDIITPYRDLYAPFREQTPAKVSGQSEGEYVFGGDTTIGNFRYVTHGISAFFDKTYVVEDPQYYPQWVADPEAPNKVRRAVYLETVKNLNLRYEDLNTPNDRYWKPNEDLDPMRRDVDNNPFNVPALSNPPHIYLNGVSIYSYGKKYPEENPYRIARSRRQTREAQTSSWTTFSALDYFETVKNKGIIKNLAVSNTGNLLIHHEDALFQTRDKAKLMTDILQVTLGSGDIFEMEPSEAVGSKIGSGGLSHILHAAQTDVGYIFADTKEGTIYIVESEGMSPISLDVDLFMKNSIRGMYGNPRKGNGITFGFERDSGRILVTSNNPEGKSFTLSYSAYTKSWSYFHDYQPEDYFHTRHGLMVIGGRDIFKTFRGDYGKYMDNKVHPFMFDAVFVNKGDDFILDAVDWRTKVEEYNPDRIDSKREFHDDTFDFITIRTYDMCTGRIPVDKKFKEYFNKNSRRALSTWSFNEFRNILHEDGEFVLDIFRNFNLIDSKLNPNIPYYKKDRIRGDHVIIRFEYLNKDNREIKVIDTNISASIFIR